tara:strand:- start:12098 stop:12505 length:408 start_codon:yes stop_codon:yes gene_type:complete
MGSDKGKEILEPPMPYSVQHGLASAGNFARIVEGRTVGRLIEEEDAKKSKEAILSLPQDAALMLASVLVSNAALILDSQSHPLADKLMPVATKLHREAKRAGSAKYRKMGTVFGKAIDRMRTRAKAVFDERGKDG